MDVGGNFMKGFVKVIVVIFSLIVVVVSSIIFLEVTGVLSHELMMDMLGILSSTKNAKIVTIIVSAIMSLLAIVLIINLDDSENTMKGEVVLPLKTGNIYITNQTFENIVYNVTRKYEKFKNVKVRILVKEDGLFVNVFTHVLQDTVVSDAILELQEDIKNTVIKQTTIAVKLVEVKVKGIYSGNLEKFQD